MHPIPRSPTIRRFLIGSSGVLVAFQGQRLLAHGAFLEAALLFGLALLAFVAALQHFEFVARPATELLTARLRGDDWWRLIPVAAAVALAVLALRNLVEVERPTYAFWRFYLGSVLLFVAGALVLDLEPRSWRDALVAWRTRIAASRQSSFVQQSTLGFNYQSPLFWVVIFVALAAFLRLWRFDSSPFGTWYDEAENGLQALRIQGDAGFRPIFVGSIHAPAHYLYLIVAAFDQFGVSTQSIRLVSVAMGLATVLAGYLAGRELFGRGGGLILAFVVAVSRWNINFSRIGMYNASTPLFTLLTIGFLLRGMRRGRYIDFALAGLCLGLGLCFYAAFQLFVGVVIFFLISLMVFERGFLRRNWSGLVILFCTALLVIAPVVKYAYTKPEIYFERTKDTSILAKKRPEERLPALIENIRKHVLMFNYRGDPNGRHNLPGEPMLDPYSAALLVLGLGLSLWRSLRGPDRARALLVPAWLGITLLGGILSLDFEAPQSLRAIGSQPAAYLLVALPLVALWQEWRRGGGRHYANFVVAPLVVICALLGYSNFHTYFFEQANDFAVWNAFSTPETITANLLNGLDDQTDAYVISFFHGHPTLNFLARGVKRYQRLETTDNLPLPWPADHKVALIVNADSSSLFDEAKRYYPNAHFEEFQPPFGGPVVIDYALLTPQDIAGVQGLTGHYYATPDWSGAPTLARKDLTLSFDWAAAPPLPAPFSVEWDGVLRVETYGAHQFFLQAPAAAELYIGEERILDGTGELAGGVILAAGNHTIRVRAVGGNGPFSLAWRPPDRGPEIVPAVALYVPPVTSNGLEGRYYPNNNWQPPAAIAKIDPRLNLYFHIPPLPRPYTVEWAGKIAIPQAGFYRFGLESIDEATLWINGQEITTSTQPNVYAEGGIDVSAGLQDIRVRFSDRTDHTHINLYWTPPGANSQLVPAQALFPPQDSYEHVTLPGLSDLVFNPQAPAAPITVSPPLRGDVRRVQTGLNQPRGVAAGPDGTIYVAETGNKRVLILDPTGEIRSQINAGSQPFVEPFDLDVDQQGNLYVLDAGAGQIAIFDAQGNYLRDLPAPSPLLDRSRGLHVDGQGRVWVADTPGGRVVAFDQEGQVVLEIPVWPGEDSQPTDMAVAANGTIFVVDSGLNKLVHFDAAGRRLLAWDTPVANSLDASHLAVDAQGGIYVTEPEQAQVALRRPDGEERGLWLVNLITTGGAVKPIGVAVGPDGRIWGADSAGGSIFVIEPKE